jgi:3-oxoacyl-[acyl-carrier protein] reductase
MTIQGKVALVTGAYRGIGLATALKLAKLGAKVAAVDLNEEFAVAISKTFAEQGLIGQGFALDVTKPDSITEALQAITATYGAPQILVNNAGITRDNLMLRMSQEEWDQVIDVNLTAVFRLTRACLRNMVKERWGRIVNISSVVGAVGNPGQANYCATKAGVVAFGKALAQEVASRGITINAVAPGFVETAMTQKLTPEQRDTILQKVPLGRICPPEDIANAVAFLVSDDASYITGQTLHVNGGMFMN